jgi:hypothetical protein
MTYTFVCYMGRLVMIGLKTFIPQLSKVLEISEIALYERQRALVRAGLLENTEGRGPGSGVRYTPETLATLLISLLATDSLSETAAATDFLLNAKRSHGERYKKLERSLAGAETFKKALANALTSTEEISLITVNRREGLIFVFLGTGQFIEFNSKRKVTAGPLAVVAHLHVEEIRELVSRTENLIAIKEAARKLSPSKSKAKDHRR